MHPAKREAYQSSPIGWGRCDRCGHERVNSWDSSIRGPVDGRYLCEACVLTEHAADTDCTVDPETGLCVDCLVSHEGPPCGTCGGLAFHLPTCREVDRLPAGRQVLRRRPRSDGT